MQYKILEKMTAFELKEYLEAHPDYRLPKKGELKIDNVYYTSVNFVKDYGTLFAETSIGLINAKYELPIIVIKIGSEKVEFIDKIKLCFDIITNRIVVYSIDNKYTLKEKTCI